MHCQRVGSTQAQDGRRHSQTQNTSFRALLAAGNEYRQEVGFSGRESHPDTVSNYGSEQRSIFQTKCEPDGFEGIGESGICRFERDHIIRYGRYMLMKIIPMKGQGKFNGTINDIKVNMTGKAELSPKNERGHSYLKLVEVKFKGFIGDARGRLVDTTKNPENSIFAETANMFYDTNRREVLDVLTPFIEEFCESLFLGVANQILSTLPFEEMFIEAAP
ncbi:uncharacterized protein LOC100159753 [Acyrthosiphon pisum]|uniref:Uncharacterized protein n=1 Tax=Acyrthosiphon pisum TaxID=7029 RepID=A0A8R1X3P2_ACYPI|nr:uncharacterized protein LOC100159753 [Acyrthosiphon pisum]|eukprot:XP_008179986.1 PREDICTED: uncharacterized protein LOC100159753 [Acyrthosiphon pisum]